MSQSLQDQLVQLKRQRATELRNAGYLFARAKRQTRRAVSPDRLVRKNLGVAMGVAFLGAMLIAPAPKKGGGKAAKGGGGGGGMMGMLMGLLKYLPPGVLEKVPGLSTLVAKMGGGAEEGPRHEAPEPLRVETMEMPAAPAEDMGEEPQGRRRRKRRRERVSLLGVILAEMVPIILARIPWQALIAGLLAKLGPRPAGAGADFPPGHPYDAPVMDPDAPPTVAVDDAGTRGEDEKVQ